MYNVLVRLEKVMYCFMSASIHCGYHVIFNRANYIFFSDIKDALNTHLFVDLLLHLANNPIICSYIFITKRCYYTC